MLAEDKKEKLKKFLAALGDNELRTLTQTIEYGRSLSIDDIPSDEILDLIRPALSDLQPEHLPKLARVLCEPCEDFFISHPQDVKRPGQIPRRIIAQFEEVTRELLDQTAGRHEQEMIAAFVSKDWSELCELKKKLWAEAAEAWEKRLSEGVDEAFRKRLSGEDGVENIREAVTSLGAAQQIIEVRKVMPKKPTLALSTDQTEKLGLILETAMEEAPEACGIILWTIFRRLKKASTIFQLFLRLDRSKTPWGTSLIKARQTIELTFLGENDERAKDLIEALKSNKTSADHIFRELDHYLKEADSAKTACSATNRAAAKEQTTARVRSLSSLVEKQVLKNVNPSVATAVNSLSELLANPQENPDELAQQIAKAEYAAMAFAKSRNVIDNIGVRTAYETARKDLTKTLKVTEDRMKRWVDEVQAKNETPNREYLLYFCRIVEMVLGPGPARDTQRRLIPSSQIANAA